MNHIVLPAVRILRLSALLVLVTGSIWAGELKLWYAQPALKWEEALPVGNGRMGAMVFGRTANERIQFNEDTLWTGNPHDYAKPDASRYLDEIRQMNGVAEPKTVEKLVRENFLGVPVRQKAYQPFGDINLKFAGHEAAVDYRRELDLDSAVARVSYRVGGTTFKREVFASYPARAIVVRLSADRKQAISFSVALTSPHRESRARKMSDDTLGLEGQVEAGGLRFESRLRISAEGGRVLVADDGCTVENADAVTLVLVAATSFKDFQDISADPAERCVHDLQNLDGKTFEQLWSEHIVDYRQLFGRVAIDLGRTPQADLATDLRLQNLRTTGLEKDPALVSLYFQYARYLLIASSRPGCQPANLQGVWNELLDPPWESKWTTNINVEMNYWPAEVMNLGECHEPLFDLISDLAVSGARTAKAYYKAGGWVLHHNTDLWRGTAPVNNIDGVWPTGGAWLCFHLWEHYQFNGDKTFLATRAYPLMKSAAQFFMDTLQKDPKTGWLVTSPSYSPEQGTLCRGPAMDSQLIRALFKATSESARILGMDTEFSGRLEKMMAALPPHQIGRYGQLQEWLDDVDRPNNNHRHMSPLWALYPGYDITQDTPKVFAAAKTLLAWRGEGSTGWSYAWRIPLWARVGDGEYAYRQLNQLLMKRTFPNLFDKCGPFQIDGNFGAPAGVAEMLLQSQRHLGDDKDVVVIDLLPALPGAWKDGEIKGLCARGGFEVDLAWSCGELTRVTLRSKLGKRCALRYKVHEIIIETERGGSYGFDGGLKKRSEKT